MQNTQHSCVFKSLSCFFYSVFVFYLFRGEFGKEVEGARHQKQVNVTSFEESCSLRYCEL